MSSIREETVRKLFKETPINSSDFDTVAKDVLEKERKIQLMLASKEVKLSLENRPRNPPPILVWDGESIVETTASDEKSLMTWLLNESKPYEVYLGQDADSSCISPCVHSIQHRMKSLIGKQRGNEIVLLVNINNNHSLHKRTKKFIAKEIPFLLAQNAEFQVYEKDGKPWEESPSLVERRTSVRISTRNHKNTIHDSDEIRSPSSSRASSSRRGTPTTELRQLRSASSSNMSVISSTSSVKQTTEFGSKRQHFANEEKINHVSETRSNLTKPLRSGEASPRANLTLGAHNGVHGKSIEDEENHDKFIQKEGKEEDDEIESKRNMKIDVKRNRDKSTKENGDLHSRKTKNEQQEEEGEQEARKVNTGIKGRRRSLNSTGTEDTMSHRTRRQSAFQSTASSSPFSSSTSPRENQKDLEESEVNNRISLRLSKKPSLSSSDTSRYPRRSQKVNYSMEISSETDSEEEEVLPTLKSRRFSKDSGLDETTNKKPKGNETKDATSTQEGAVEAKRSRDLSSPRNILKQNDVLGDLAHAQHHLKKNKQNLSVVKTSIEENDHKSKEAETLIDDEFTFSKDSQIASNKRRSSRRNKTSVPAVTEEELIHLKQGTVENVPIEKVLSDVPSEPKRGRRGRPKLLVNKNDKVKEDENETKMGSDQKKDEENVELAQENPIANSKIQQKKTSGRKKGPSKSKEVPMDSNDVNTLIIEEDAEQLKESLETPKIPMKLKPGRKRIVKDIRPIEKKIPVESNNLSGNIDGNETIPENSHVNNIQVNSFQDEKLLPINVEGLLTDSDSVITTIDLRDVISVNTFLEAFTPEERAALYPLLPEIDTRGGEDLLKLFRHNMHFLSSLDLYQRLLRSGCFDPTRISTARNKRRRIEGWTSEKEKNLEAFYGQRIEPSAASKEETLNWKTLDNEIIEKVNKKG